MEEESSSPQKDDTYGSGSALSQNSEYFKIW